MIWRQLKHPHILQLWGVDGGVFPQGHIPYCIISPWAKQGTLASFIATDAYDPKRDLYRLVCTLLI
jgi:hypothetical protein